LSLGRPAYKVARIADDALASFLKILVDIHNSNRDGALAAYARDPRLAKVFPEGYAVKMGFGLHIGWAIEGAIGSSYKIDASYLSPHVNLASRLEAATKQYGVPLLISADFAQELSPGAQAYLRLLDRVTVKGSKVPVELYTFDIEYYPRSLGESRANLMPRTREQEEAYRVTRTRPINIDFGTDKNIRKLQHGLSDSFFSTFHKGVLNYLDGRWPAAQGYLRRVLNRYKPGDGPCLVLLKYMRNHGKVRYHPKPTQAVEAASSSMAGPIQAFMGSTASEQASSWAMGGDRGSMSEVDQTATPGGLHTVSEEPSSGLQGSIGGNTGIGEEKDEDSTEGSSEHDAKVQQPFVSASASNTTSGQAATGSGAMQTHTTSSHTNGPMPPGSRTTTPALQLGRPPSTNARKRGDETDEEFEMREITSDELVWESPSSWKGYRALTEK